MADDVKSYLQSSYWNERFAEEEHYEWFKEYSHFRHLVHSSIVDKQSKILELGCGNSQMSEEMYKDGYKNITATDLSPVAVRQKQQRCSTKGYADILDLPFEDSSFDVIIEKGVMDCLFVDSGSSWDPKPEARRRVEKMLKEAHRVLCKNGIMISIAFGQPHFRRPFLEADGLQWCMEYTTFGDGFHYFFYTLRKGSLKMPKKIDLHVDARGDILQEQMDDSDYLLRTMISDE